MHDRFQSKIAVSVGIARVTLKSGKDHVVGFPRARKVYSILTGSLTIFHNLTEKVSRLFPNHGVLVMLEKSMTVEFDKNPFRSTFDADAGISPAIEAPRLSGPIPVGQ